MKKAAYQLTEKEVEQEIIARYKSESMRPETEEQRRIAEERMNLIEERAIELQKKESDRFGV